MPQQKVRNCPGQYKKIGREKKWGMQIEDYETLADDKQIKKYCESSQAQEAFSIFRELRIKEKKLSQNECCTVGDYLFVIKEPGNANDSGVYVNMLMSEHGKRQYKDTY